MSGRPALRFVHGLACKADDWDLLRDLLAEDFACRAPDLGFFEAEAGQERSLDIAELATRVTADLSDRNVLIGHSLGCRVVLQAAVERPDAVEALVLLDGSRLSNVDPAVMLGPIAADADAFLEDFFGQMMGPMMPSDRGRALIDRAKRIDQHALAEALDSMMRWDREQSRAALASLANLPILVMQSSTLGGDGKRRPLGTGETNAWMETVSAESAKAKLVTLAGFGHFPMIEKPEAVAGPLRAFLASL